MGTSLVIYQFWFIIICVFIICVSISHSCSHFNRSGDSVLAVCCIMLQLISRNSIFTGHSAPLTALLHYMCITVGVNQSSPAPHVILSCHIDLIIALVCCFSYFVLYLYLPWADADCYPAIILYHCRHSVPTKVCRACWTNLWNATDSSVLWEQIKQAT